MKGASIEWTVAVEIGFYLFFTAILMLPAALSQMALSITTAVGMLSLIFIPSGKWFEIIIGIRWGILTGKADVSK